jgi:hypothetical protein
MARLSKPLGKNYWALFLLLLLGIVIGGFLGYLTKNVEALKWINYGKDFSIGGSNKGNVVTLDLAVIVIHFGLQIKITIGSVIGAIAAVFIYKKL